MRFNALSTAALALASASMVSAQTKSKCDPTKEKGCKPDPAFGKNKVSCDFTKGECDAFSELDGTSLEYEDKGAVFSIKKDGNAPTIETDKYIFFGRVDVDLQIAPGGGIITSVVFESDDLDEIDWEWVGSDDGHVLTNYFGKGDDGTYNRGGTHDVSAASSTFHTYSVDWTPESINWMVDGKSVRTLSKADANGKYPQSPMRIKLGTWAPTDSNSQPGTIEWANGPADFANGPFNAYYKKVTIVDYAGGSKPTDKDVKEYVYGDNSGKAESIQVKLGDGSSDDSDDSDDSDSSSTKKDDSKTSTAAESTGSTKAPASTTGAETTMHTSTHSATESSGPSKTSDSSDSDESTSPTSVPGAAGRQAIAVGSAIFGAVAAAAVLY